ncbi:MAG: retropepsin-like aspartic protease [Terricaulis sp.]
MLLRTLALCAGLCLATPALAQTSITLEAAPVAIIDAQINGRPVRLEVDSRMPDMLALSTPAAERLGVRRLPFAQVQVGIEGGGSMRGRIARPNIRFGERSARNMAGIFPVPVSTLADGVIGPGSLPYDIVTLRLGPDASNHRDIVLPLENGDLWYTQAEVGGHTLRVLFDITNEASIFNRASVRMFDREGAIPAAGELAERPLILGLSTNMQPVTTQLTAYGLSLGPTFARTLAPLLGALEEDAIVVEGEGEAQTPSLTIGRAALTQAGCSSISANRRTRQLTLRCAA